MYNNKEKESTAREGVAWVGSTMQVDDERNGRSLLAIKGEARIVGGRGEESLGSSAPSRNQGNTPP